MALSTGTRLGPYEILAAIGAGGMGEVYRARDTRLHRTVAIKVLPSPLSDNEDLKQRFEREARAISSLQDPHICTLHDIGSQDGVDFLVMEYLDGETLAGRLTKGRIPLEQALRIGMEIAGALDKAHRRGIVHRDLKPGNIMLTSGGAKLMDFGLAKPSLGFGATPSQPLTPSTPTITVAALTSPPSPLTQKGQIVGTFQYMAPEVLQGGEADIRSDIFALGAVLFEMLTGRRAFDGRTQLSVASAILEQDPEPLTRIDPTLPASLGHVVGRCLSKSPDERYQSALDVKFELQWAGGSAKEKAPAARAAVRERTAWLAAMLILVAASTFVARRSAPPRPAGSVIQAYLPPPTGAEFILSEDDLSGPAVLSRTGTMAAFSARTKDSPPMVWIEALRDAKARPLAGTEGGTYPFWSPDEKWVGFFADGKLKKAPVGGGAVLPLADAARGRGGSWNQFGQILYAPQIQTELFLVSASGGTPTKVTELSVDVHTTHRWPVWLPDGKSFLYLATNHTHPEPSERNGIYVGSLDGKTGRMLVPAASSAAYGGGSLFYVVHGALMAQPFDAASRTVSGDPALIGEDVLVNPGTWRGAFDVAGTDVVVYQGGSSTAMLSELVWKSPHMADIQKIPGADPYYQVRLSPDGGRVAYTVGDPHSVLTVLDLKRNSRTRLTFEGTADDTFAWSPDGKRIAFGQRRSGPLNLYMKNSDGSGPPELIYADTFDKNVNDWSPDGEFLLYHAQAAGTDPIRLFVLQLTGEPKPQVLAQAPAPSIVYQGMFSPDGKWVTYTSNESSRSEVYLTNFPHPSGKWQISAAGGSQAHWRADGNAIVYLSADGHTLMQVPVALHDNAAQVGVADEYLKADGIFVWHSGMSYDLVADGRALINTRIGQDPHQITVLVNWAARRR